MQFWITLFSSGALSAALTGTLIFLSKSLIGARIEQSIRHEYEERLVDFRCKAEHQNQLEIERLRSNFAALQSTQTTALKALSEGQRITHERVLDAIANLWSEIVRLKCNIPYVILFMNFLKNDEYSTLVQRTDQRERVKKAVESNFVEGVDQALVENARLFAGNDLYAVFFVYQQILGRILFLLQKGLDEGRLDAWYEDHGMESILGVTFSEEELRLITCNGFNELRTALEILEQRFLKIADGLLSGKNAAQLTMSSVREILRLSGDLALDKARSNNVTT